MYKCKTLLYLCIQTFGILCWLGSLWRIMMILDIPNARFRAQVEVDRPLRPNINTCHLNVPLGIYSNWDVAMVGETLKHWDKWDSTMAISEFKHGWFSTMVETLGLFTPKKRPVTTYWDVQGVCTGKRTSVKIQHQRQESHLWIGCELKEIGCWFLPLKLLIFYGYFEKLGIKILKICWSYH